jgi:hypothetical protein
LFVTVNGIFAAIRIDIPIVPTKSNTLLSSVAVAAGSNQSLEEPNPAYAGVLFMKILMKMMANLWVL